MKKQGNINILVLFVLLSASLIGVLTMNFVQQMINSADTLSSYYHAYYLSRAGLELLVSQAKQRGIGFETSINSGSKIFKENFLCTHCDVVAKMQGTSTTLSKEFRKEYSGSNSCVSPFVLEEGEALLIPMIRDTFSGNIAESFTHPPQYENLSSYLKNLSFVLTSGTEIEQSEINIGLFILSNTGSGDELLSDGIFVKTGILRSGTPTMEDFVKERENIASTMSPYPGTLQTLNTYYTDSWYPFKNYLIIANTSPKTISFCINAPGPLPTQDFYITSHGLYHDKMLGLELIYKQALPNFLMNSILGNKDGNMNEGFLYENQNPENMEK